MSEVTIVKNIVFRSHTGRFDYFKRFTTSKVNFCFILTNHISVPSESIPLRKRINSNIYISSTKTAPTGMLLK